MSALRCSDPPSVCPLPPFLPPSPLFPACFVHSQAGSRDESFFPNHPVVLGPRYEETAPRVPTSSSFLPLPPPITVVIIIVSIIVIAIVISIIVIVIIIAIAIIILSIMAVIIITIIAITPIIVIIIAVIVTIIAISFGAPLTRFVAP